MPREFTDFTRDVAGGAEEIRKSLDRVSTSAKGADVSSAGLSDTQKAARDIARKYDKAMSSVSTTQETVGKSASKAARGLSKLNAAAGSAMATVGGVGPAYGGIAAAIATFQSSLSGLAGSVAASSGVLGGLLKTQEEIAEKEVKKFPWIESYKDELSSIEVDLFKMEKGLLKMSKQEFVDASVAAAGRRAFVEFSEALDEAWRWRGWAWTRRSGTLPRPTRGSRRVCLTRPRRPRTPRRRRGRTGERSIRHRARWTC